MMKKMYKKYSIRFLLVLNKMNQILYDRIILWNSEFYVSNVKSLESSYENTTSEPFLCLDLEIGDIKTLEGCIDKYTRKEVLDMKIEVNEKTKKERKCK